MGLRINAPETLDTRLHSMRPALISALSVVRPSSDPLPVLKNYHSRSPRRGSETIQIDWTCCRLNIISTKSTGIIVVPLFSSTLKTRRVASACDRPFALSGKLTSLQECIE